MVLSFIKTDIFLQPLDKLFGFFQVYQYLLCYLSEVELLRNFTLSISDVFYTSNTWMELYSSTCLL